MLQACLAWRVMNHSFFGKIKHVILLLSIGRDHKPEWLFGMPLGLCLSEHT